MVTDFLGEVCLLLKLFRNDVYRLLPTSGGTRMILDVAHDCQKRQFPY
jgi:hypothetical protein